MSTRTTLALFLLAIVCSFLRGYLALGPAGVLWHLAEMAPLSDAQSVDLKQLPDSTKESLLDLNVANAKELESLPGIGPTIAARVIEYRMTKGRFSSLEELLKVNGIGAAKLEQIQPYLTIGETDEH